MPIPLLLGALAVGAGVVGIGGHLSAKETNEEAERVLSDAQSIYNRAKNSLMTSRSEAEKSLGKLAYTKKNILDTSMKQFLKAYDRVKDVRVKDSIGLNELSKFSISAQDAVELRQLTDIYTSSLSSGAAGAATGAAIALAASGSLSVVTGGLGVAGSFLAAGEIGAAASMTGATLLTGAAMTPLAAFVAPAVLFTGVSASMKADENLEKAKASHAEAEAAAEKMKISETVCCAIRDRTVMFDELLADLNEMFAPCALLLDRMTRQKTGFFGNKVIKTEELTSDEVRLIAVTRSLAGAVKAVIDTQILTENGTLTSVSKETYDDTYPQLPEFQKVVEEVEGVDYGVLTNLTKVMSKETVKQFDPNKVAGDLWKSTRNAFTNMFGKR